MPTLEIIQALIVLLPGFVTTGVIRALYVGTEESDLDKVVRSLAYSFIDYVIFAAVHARNAMNYLDPPLAKPAHTGDVVVLGVISVTLGCVVAAYKNNDGHRLLRWARVTYRSSRPNIWHDSFVEGTKYHVIVTLEDKRRILGWPVRYGDDLANPSIFLVDAAWIDEQGKETPVGNEGILILAPMKIVSVEFLRNEDTDTPSNPQLKSEAEDENNGVQN